jgi:hypothetical protein
VRDLLADPQVQARGSADVVTAAVAGGGPELGEHTAEVTGEWLGS